MGRSGVTWNELAKIWALAAPWSGEEHAAWLNASKGAYGLMYERDLMPHGVNSAEEALSGAISIEFRPFYDRFMTAFE